MFFVPGSIWITFLLWKKLISGYKSSLRVLQCKNLDDYFEWSGLTRLKGILFTGILWLPPILPAATAD